VDQPSPSQSDPERELRQANERYRAFVANSSEGIWRFELEQPIPVNLPPDEFIDRAYRYGYLGECNDAMARMYGFEKAEQIVGARLEQFLVREDPNNQAYLGAFVKSGFRLVDAESHEVDSQGRDKYFLNNLVGVIEGGQLVRAWGTQRDVTEQKAIEAKLRATADRAEAANRAKTEFLSVLSHELRTPLTPILLMVTMLEQKPDLPADVREDMAMIRENVQLEAQLIDELLDISRISRGKLKLEKSDIDVHPLVTAAAEAAKSEDAAPITVELSATRSKVHGDPARVTQILRALLSNAVKFTPRKGQIAVRTRNPDPGTLAVDVSDTGIGIDPDLFARIFRIFETGDQSTRRQHGGLGLGLPISHWLAEAHGGELRAFSEGKNRGSTFTLILPAIRE
jgi:signal transduction histidine kinase